MGVVHAGTDLRPGYCSRVEPIPETAEAVEEYGPFMAGGEDALAHLRSVAGRVRQSVPECVGMSLATLKDGVTLTLVATDEEIAALDGVQYLSGGPCVSAVEEDRYVEYHATDVLDEDSWHLFARATAASGIASTLTLPIVADDRAVGSVNLYAATPHAFTGRQEVVAAIVGGWAPGAVANADLGFSTRQTAEQAPRILLDDMRIQVAVGIIVASEGIDVETARARLRQAAERAGVSETVLARKVIADVTLPEDAEDAEGRDGGGDADRAAGSEGDDA
jgi:GAF domain-containing protein